MVMLDGVLGPGNLIQRVFLLHPSQHEVYTTCSHHPLWVERIPFQVC